MYEYLSINHINYIICFTQREWLVAVHYLIKLNECFYAHSSSRNLMSGKKALINNLIV